MLARALGALAAVELAAPRRVVAVAERLAFRDRGTSRLRPWTIPLARLEAVAFTALARRPSVAARLVPLLGLLGVPAVLAPRRYVQTGLWMAYEDSETIELREWVVPATRVLGLVYLAVVLRWLLDRPKR